MTFIGRKNELERLRRVCRSQQPQIAVVYGRRQIGKSLLIQQAFQEDLIDKGYFYRIIEGRDFLQVRESGK